MTKKISVKDIATNVGTTDDTYKGILLKTLAGNVGKPVPRKTLMATMYGRKAGTKLAGFNMALREARKGLQKSKLPFVIVAGRTAKKECTYEIIAK